MAKMSLPNDPACRKTHIYILQTLLYLHNCQRYLKKHISVDVLRHMRMTSYDVIDDVMIFFTDVVIIKGHWCNTGSREFM